MKHIAVAALAAFTLAVAGTTQAEEPAGPSPPEEEFAGLKFGVGLSLTLDTGSHDRVNDAELVNGLVRVKDEDNARARIMLESHYFFEFNESVNPMKALTKSGRWGTGPFVAIQPGDNEIIEAAALGWMVGFEREASKGGSWNLGIGYVFDPNTKTLGDGLSPNRPLPAGETVIRYKERAQKGIVILTSFTF